MGHVRADELPLGPAMDNIEQQVLDAAKAEGKRRRMKTSHRQAS